MNLGQQELRRAFKRLDRELPPRLAAWMRWLRHPASRWVRLPAGALLIIGGCLSILPVLGLWMLPLGLLLLAMDTPFLQRPMARLVTRILDWLERRRRRAES
ncbi:hypothetical protein [Bosea sp. NBC_00550]|uniref:hypothetical protein n=1 Tax=Bosea sp. NBC_00550 TaxID=2969621 RepID=UPI00222E9625|nr:hypothetical protein [Bosea sp. NBC_00550]UZF93937.1 hypothetical protein NWE53_07040 [Bosea sp. NBC_00550]